MSNASTDFSNLFPADVQQWTVKEWAIIGGAVAFLLLIIIIIAMSARSKKSNKEEEEALYVKEQLAKADDVLYGKRLTYRNQYQRLPENALRGSSAPVRRGTMYGKLVDDQTLNEQLGYGVLPDLRRDSDMELVVGDE